MKYPLVPPLAVCVLGILAGCYWGGGRDTWAFIALPAGIAAALCCGLAVRGGLRAGLLLASLFLAVVYSVTSRLEPLFPAGHIAHFADGAPVLLEGTLYKDPRWGDGYTQLFFRCRMVRGPGPPRQVRGDAELYVAERVEQVRAGDRIAVEARLKTPRHYGNPGEPDLVRRCFLRGIYVRGTVSDSFHLVVLGHERTGRILETAARVRAHLMTFFQKVSDPSARGLLCGLILGDRSSIPHEVVESFRATGLSHLLAISGLHVGLVGVFVYGLMRVLLRRSTWVLLHWPVRKLAAVASLPFLVFYVLVAGAPVTAVRALLMGCVAIGALLIDRVNVGLNAVVCAALAILLVEPGALFSPSFQLSCAAVVSILVVSPRLVALLRDRYSAAPGSPRPTLRVKLVTAAWGLFSVSLAAAVGTWPLIATYFHQVSLVSVWANLVVVPLVGWVAIPCALAASVVSMLSPLVAAVPLHCAAWALEGAARIAKVLAEVPHAWVRVGSPTPAEIVVSYLVPLLWVWDGPRRWRRWCIGACLAFLCASWTWAWLGPSFSKDLVVTFLSVGQGQSILMELPGGRRMLLDGGMAREGSYDAGERIIAPCLWKKRIGRIDYLVVTHGESDHYGGLGYIAEHFEVDEVWVTPLGGDEGEGYSCFLALCSRKGIARKTLHRGLGPLRVGPVVMDVLNPAVPEEWGTSDLRTQNDRSLVLKVVYGESTFLFTGDISGRVEQMLVRSYGDMISSAVLSVPHHGSDSSSTEPFLRTVHPSVAVASVGSANRFGFPKQGVADRYERLGIPLYRTDLDGAVCIKSDGRATVMRVSLGSRKGKRFRIAN